MSLFDKKPQSVCYVCSEVIKDGQESVYIGKGMSRHEGCAPGSAKWLKSIIGRKSSLKKFFETKEDSND